LALPKFLRSVGAQAQAESSRSRKFKNIWFSSRLFVTLASPKSLPLEKIQKHLVFFSLIRNFEGRKGKVYGKESEARQSRGVVDV